MPLAEGGILPDVLIDHPVLEVDHAFGPFSHRIVVRHHLPGLARDELPRYLEHRLRLAGTELPLFTAPAIEALFQATNGMPRKLNRIAHYALTAAAIDEQHQVNDQHLFTALEELRP